VGLTYFPAASIPDLFPGMHTGTANPFGIAAAQERGRMFIQNKDDVYRDMIIGVHQRPGDLHVRYECAYL
jgi:predicted membrane GTPase involved in stress response